MSSIDSTLAERGSRYGEFPEHAFVTQEIKRVLHGHANWGGLADDQKEALDMVAHKIGRIINGDPNYIDSWTDIIGYTRLVEKRLIGAEQAAAKSLLKDPAPLGDKPPTQPVPEKAAEKKAENPCNCPGCELDRILAAILPEG